MGIALIDLTKTFNTIDSTLLRSVMPKFICSRRFVAIVKAFDTNMNATVLIGGDETETLPVKVEGKQGCALAPVIFNSYMVAVTILFRQRSPNELEISITYRLDGSVFNLSRLQAQTKTT